MKTCIYNFSGPAYLLWPNLLNHALKETATLNKKIDRTIASPLHTIEHLTKAAKFGDGPWNGQRRSQEVRRIITRGNIA